MTLSPLSVRLLFFLFFTERGDVDYGAYYSPPVCFVALRLLNFDCLSWSSRAGQLKPYLAGCSDDPLAS